MASEPITLFGPDDRPLDKAQYGFHGELTTPIAPFEGPTIRTSNRGAMVAGATARGQIDPQEALQAINPNLWPFDPGMPLTPITTGGGGIRWAPPSGYNVTYNPDVKIGIANAKLRLFADQCAAIRIIIEQLKREFIGLETDIVPLDGADERTGPTKERIKLREWWDYPDPDQELDREAWLMQVMEDAIVIGAPAIWRMHDYGGNAAGLRPIDAALIKPYLTSQGIAPKPPTIAYSFSSYSLPYVGYTTDELVYRPMEPRTWTPYGFGAVESTIAYVLIQIYRSLFYVHTYDESDTPPGWVTLPKEWTPAMVKEFAEWMAEKFGGEQPDRHHTRYMPADSKYQQVKQMPDWDYEFDEYFMRVFAWRLGVSPTPVAKTSSIGKGSEGLSQEALAAGVRPMQKVIQRIVNLYIRDDRKGVTWEGESFPRGFGIKGYGLDWVEEREENKQLKLQENQTRQQLGQISINGARKAYGDDPLNVKDYPLADEPMLLQGGVWTPLNAIAQAPKGGTPVPEEPPPGEALPLPPGAPQGGKGSATPPAFGAKPGQPLAAQDGEPQTVDGSQQAEKLAKVEDFRLAQLASPEKGITVWLVNGEHVEAFIDPDFTQGANGYARPQYCPQDEVWIDDRQPPASRKYSLLHEYTELCYMRDHGDDYDTAHAKANVREQGARQEDQADGDDPEDTKKAARTDLRKWQRFAKKQLALGKSPRHFDSEVINPVTRAWVEKSLAEGNLQKAFRRPKTWLTSPAAQAGMAALESWATSVIPGWWDHYAQQATAALAERAKPGTWKNPTVTAAEAQKLTGLIEAVYQAGYNSLRKAETSPRVRRRAGELIGKHWDEDSETWVNQPVESKFYIPGSIRDRISGMLDKQFEAGTASGGLTDTLIDELTADLKTRISDARESDSINRAQMISRTETRNFYNQGAVDNFREMGVEQVEISDGSGLGDECDERDGDVVTLDEFESLNEDSHPNCLPSGTVVLAPQGILEAVYVREYKGKLAVIRTAGGDELSATLNHPVLTGRGWVAAGEVKQGDYLVRCTDVQGMLDFFDPDHENAPALIEDVTSTFLKTCSVTANGMPCSPIDFHGDGAGSEVYIVGTNGALGDGIINTNLSQEGGKVIVERRPVGAGALLPDSLAAQVGEALLCTPNGSMSSGGDALSILGSTAVKVGTGSVAMGANGQAEPMEVLQKCSKVEADILGNFCAALAGKIPDVGGMKLFCREFADGLSAQWQPKLGHPTVDATVSYAENLGNALHRFALLVELSEVVEVKVIPFSGHVHNLHTASGWYVAENYCIRNCTLAAIPVLEDLEE